MKLIHLFLNFGLYKYSTDKILIWNAGYITGVTCTNVQYGLSVQYIP